MTTEQRPSNQSAEPEQTITAINWPTSKGDPIKPVWSYGGKKGLYQAEALRAFAHDLVEIIREHELPLKAAMKQAGGDGLNVGAYIKTLVKRINGLESANTDLRRDLARTESARVAILAENTHYKRAFADEHAIVDRIWKQLGIETYEQSGGKSIYEIIAERTAHEPPAVDPIAPVAQRMWIEGSDDSNPGWYEYDEIDASTCQREGFEPLYTRDTLRASQPPPAAPLREVVQAVVDWNTKYPSSRIYDETSIRRIAAEMDVIFNKAKAALAAYEPPKADQCEVCKKPLPPIGAWSMPSCPECQELLEGLGEMMADFADREQTIKADWIGRAINLICARALQPPPAVLDLPEPHYNRADNIMEMSSEDWANVRIVFGHLRQRLQRASQPPGDGNSAEQTLWFVRRILLDGRPDEAYEVIEKYARDSETKEPSRIGAGIPPDGAPSMPATEKGASDAA